MSGFTAAPVLPDHAGRPKRSSSRPSPIPSGRSSLRPGDATITFRGDAEAGVALTLLDHWDRDGRRGGFRAAVEGLVRFPTGSSSQPDRLYAVGTGDGQTDVEVRITADLGAGNFGIRLEGDYNRQLAADFAAPRGAADASRSSGERLHHRRAAAIPATSPRVAARPFFRLARTLAIQGTRGLLVARRRRGGLLDPRGRDPRRGPERARGGHQGERDGARDRAHLRQSRARSSGRTWLPVDAGWSYERVVQSAGGTGAEPAQPSRRGFRVYFGLF